MLSRTGRTSYAIVRDKMKKKGEDVNCMTMFMKTRTKKNGSIGDEDSAEAIHQMNELMSEIPEDERTTSVGNQIFGEVFGTDARGRVRMQGLVPSSVQSAKKHKINEERIREDERRKAQVIIDEVNSKYDRVIQMLESQQGNTNLRFDPNATEQVHGVSDINLVNIRSSVNDQVHGPSTSH
ncbi:hypothetical protein Sjap_002196 [Stephania japonica]|uniref:Uncharacterized protein n=1 Tax=Stephania japonica TaxID=461633 RepID=A0AAP0KLF3_9MAGN